jgi:hypothetical protein
MQVHSEIGPKVSNDEVFLAANAMKGNSQPKWNLYYSRVRYAVTAVSTTPFQYTIAATSLLAFSYGIGQSATSAGLPLAATEADTSLTNAGQTINAEFVVVRGCSLFLVGQSDPLLAKALYPLISTVATFGSTSYKLGTPDMLPSFGGMSGMSESNICSPNLYEQFAKGIGGLSNGAPIAGNVRTFPRSLIWMPAGKGDSAQFQLKLQSYASATLLSNQVSADRTAGTAGSTYNGAPAAWTHPTLASASVYVDFLAVLDHIPYYEK